ncbi:hypothetical protein AKJ08_0040 [Vulgatibacter incomptus]|uniref:Uncharacterized protein n=1 Tax=Vulgatibacter incomptus TaxID=1391653 RepID=A0A0K1P7Y9_9BACT|nr:hypothetical protein AKJ08_0040 [Vulgatibacter incomptus]
MRLFRVELLICAGQVLKQRFADAIDGSLEFAGTYVDDLVVAEVD